MKNEELTPYSGYKDKNSRTVVFNCIVSRDLWNLKKSSNVGVCLRFRDANLGSWSYDIENFQILR